MSNFTSTFEPTFVPTLAPTFWIANNVTYEEIGELIEELLPFTSVTILVLCFASILCLIIGSICASWCCFPCRYRCLELCDPKPTVNTLRTCEAVGMGTATLAVLYPATIILIICFILSWELGIVVLTFGLLIGGCCIYMFYREGQTYEEMGPDTKVVASLGYQAYYDPPYPPLKTAFSGSQVYDSQYQADTGYHKDTDRLVGKV